MAASSNAAGQPKFDPRNAFDGLRVVLSAPAASSQQVYPKLSAFSGLRVVPPAPAASGRQVYPIVSAYDGLRIASPAPASSSGTKHLPYDVFINHHGRDAKFTVANSIYNCLHGLGLRIFFDKNSLTPGDFFPRAAEEAMRSASIHIAIFSEHYAQSPWCLAQLYFMLNTGTKIIPVFYHVEPFTLRWAIQGKGLYAEAFSNYEIKSRYSSEKLQQWKWALHEASFYSGYMINNQRDEQRAVKNLVNHILKELKDVPLEVAKHPVGLDEAVQNFFEMIPFQSSGWIQIMGIWGVGGSGKTTLAKEIYNRKCSTIGRSCFLFDIRDAAEKGLLVEKQKKLLDDLGANGLSFDNVEEGKAILANRVRSVSVLIILDDVDSTDQLDALLPAREMFGRGSLIIVTTRKLDVLETWGISAIYEMKPLSPTNAEQLFCWHAFLQSSPLSGFEDLVKKFVSACHGLPLSLEVLGGQLYGKSSDKHYWQYLLSEISKIDHKHIKSWMRVSYDALHDEEKRIFLDVACFLIGEKKSLAVAIWDGLWQLESLMNKSLVELDQDSCIRMQASVRDLGREIANEQPPYRLWSSTQIDLIREQAETLQVRGIMAAITEFSSCSAYPKFPNYSSRYQPPFKECLDIMHNSASRPPLGLKFLVITGDDFSRKFAKLSEELVWLRWFDFKDTKLPSWPSLKKLRVLELYGATTLKELWDDDTHPPFSQLTELNITCSWGSSLQRFPSSISDLKHLKKIALIGYLEDEFPIERLPEEFCNLEKLEHLELRHCRVLSSLPSRFGELTMLRHLDLSSCVELRMLPDSFNQLKHLEYLDLSGCRSLTFRLDLLEKISKLENVDFSGCRRLQELPERIVSQAYLRQLNMRGTRIRIMPSKMGQLKRLENLQIGSPSLTDLPSSLGDLSSLSRLTIFDCPNLIYFPDSVESLNGLEYLCIESSGVESLPKSFTKLAYLQSLKISGCPISNLDFEKAFFSPSCLRSLKLLHIEDTQVSRISISEDCCPALETLRLRQNEVLVDILTLPISLKEIELWECEKLQDIRGIHVLSYLKSTQIKISGCPELLDSIFT